MRVEEVRDRSRVDALKAPWKTLFDRVPGADLFQSWEWMTCWLDCFWRDRPLAFLFVWDGDELAGVAPLVDDREAEISCSGSFSMPVNSHARRLDVLCAKDAAPVLEAMLSHLRRRGRSVRLTLRQSPEDSPIVAALPTAARRNWFATTRLAQRTCPVVRIDGTWDQYLATRSSHVRRELTRKLRRVEREYQFTWLIATSVEDCARAMEDVRRIERTSWKEREGTSLTAEAAAARLYEDFAPRFAAAGWARIYLLHLNGKPAAHILGAQIGSNYYALKTSYDESFRQASPGQALFFFALKDAFERKLKTFDFLGDESRWKTELANATRRQVDVCAHEALDAGCLWHELSENTLKPLARKAGPKLVALRNRFAPRPQTAPAPAPAPAPITPIGATQVAAPPATEEPTRQAG